MIFANSLLAFATGITLASASPILAHRATINQPSLPLPAKTIFQFNETGTWIENLAVRPNGDLLMTTLTPEPSLFTLKQPYTPSPKLALVHTFDNATSLTGIAETRPDVFIVLATKAQGVGDPVPGSFAVWEVSLRNTSSSSPSVRKITDFPEAQLANGVASVSPSGGSSNVVLIGDSYGGCLWRLDTQTGAYETVVKVAEMAAPAGGALPIGINGLKVHDGYAYWSNSATARIYRARIDSRGYPVTGTEANSTVDTMASLIPDSYFVDDFGFDRYGLLWAATNSDNKVDVVRTNGSFETVVGGASEDTVGGDTAVAFGRSVLDRDVVYVSTSGVLPNNRTEPAKIVAVDRAGYR